MELDDAKRQLAALGIDPKQCRFHALTVSEQRNDLHATTVGILAMVRDDRWIGWWVGDPNCRLEGTNDTDVMDFIFDRIRYATVA